MSMFLGIYGNAPREDFQAMIQALDIRSTDRTHSHDTPDFKCFHLDIGAWEGAGTDPEDPLPLALAGNPILGGGHRDGARKVLADNLRPTDLSVLDQCRGSFALCQYHPPSRSLILATDKAGVRPLYYVFHRGALYFSTALKCLTRLPGLGEFSPRGLAQDWSFGAPLGTATRFQKIRVLRDGQALVMGPDETQARPLDYHRWDTLPTTKAPPSPEVFHDIFTRAVALRCPPGNQADAFLSGGLDSRCITAALQSLDKEVRVFNSYLPGEQDQAFTRDYARAAGLELISLPRAGTAASTRALLADTIQEAENHLGQRPGLIFSGDGGSVPMGHVYLEQDLVRALERGDTPGARTRFMDQRQLPLRVLARGLFQADENPSFDGLDAELADLDTPDPLQAFFLFLLRNDQRCHLHGYFEDLDQIRTELALPFFDARLLEHIVAAPRNPFLYHDFYHDWLTAFPPQVMATAWQTYPGHRPCPVASPHGESLTQWEAKPGELTWPKRMNQARDCLRGLVRSDFPAAIISRPRVVATLVAHVLGLRDYRYVFKFCRHIQALTRTSA